MAKRGTSTKRRSPGGGIVLRFEDAIKAGAARSHFHDEGSDAREQALDTACAWLERMATDEIIALTPVLVKFVTQEEMRRHGHTSGA